MGGQASEYLLFFIKVLATFCCCCFCCTRFASCVVQKNGKNLYNFSFLDIFCTCRSGLIHHRSVDPAFLTRLDSQVWLLLLTGVFFSYLFANVFVVVVVVWWVKPFQFSVVVASFCLCRRHRRHCRPHSQTVHERGWLQSPSQSPCASQVHVAPFYFKFVSFFFLFLPPEWPARNCLLNTTRTRQ